MTRFGIFNAPLSVAKSALAGTVLERKITSIRVMRKLDEFAGNATTLFDLIRECADAGVDLILTLRNPIDSPDPKERQDRPYTPETFDKLFDVLLAVRTLELQSEDKPLSRLLKRRLLTIQVANELLGNANGGHGWIPEDQYQSMLDALEQLYRMIPRVLGRDVRLMAPALMERNCVNLVSGSPTQAQLFARALVDQAERVGAMLSVNLHGGPNNQTGRALSALSRYCIEMFGRRLPTVATEWSAGYDNDTDEKMRLRHDEQWTAMVENNVLSAHGPFFVGLGQPVGQQRGCLMLPGNRELNVPVVESVGRVVSASGSGGEVEGEMTP